MIAYIDYEKPADHEDADGAPVVGSEQIVVEDDVLRSKIMGRLGSSEQPCPASRLAAKELDPRFGQFHKTTSLTTMPLRQLVLRF